MISPQVRPLGPANTLPASCVVGPDACILRGPAAETGGSSKQPQIIVNWELGVVLGSGLLLGTLSVWLTPVWLISVGAACGFVVLAIAYGLVALASPRLAAWIRMSLWEGILLPLTMLSIFLTAFALLATPGVPFRELLTAVGRIPFVGTAKTELTVPPATEDFMIPLSGGPPRTVSPGRVARLRNASDGPLMVLTHVSKGAGHEGAVNLTAGVVREWHKPSPTDEVLPVDLKDWSANNLTDKAIHLTMLIHTDIQYPEVRIVPLVAAGLIGLYLVYLAISLAFPKIAVIAATTSKESMGQPLFPVAIALGAFAILLFVIIPYNTFGEDVKMFKDSGLTSVMLLAILVAVWSASVSVADEIEGRTALTLLSKPVRRHQFILGKFLGILWPIVLCSCCWACGCCSAFPIRWSTTLAKSPSWNRRGKFAIGR